MKIEHMTADEIISNELDVPAEHFRRIVSDIRSETLIQCPHEAAEGIEYLSEKVARLEHKLKLYAPILRSVKEFLTKEQLETLRVCGVIL